MNNMLQVAKHMYYDGDNEWTTVNMVKDEKQQMKKSKIFITEVYANKLSKDLV